MNKNTNQAAGILLFLSCLTVHAEQVNAPLEINLKGSWRFAASLTKEGGDQGAVEKWFADGFDDAAWKTLVTGKPWSKQSVEHNGWGWFRKKISVPKEYAGSTPLVLQLGENQSDDDVWFNGVWVGGVHGKYKYKNFLQRVYTVPASVIRFGESNTIAVRVWGGNLGFINEASQGLVAGNFSATLDPYYVSMRFPLENGAGGRELPAQLFDLSDAQRGKPFEIIFRFPGDKIDDTAKLQCELKDFSGGTIASLSAPVEKNKDCAFAVVKINAEIAQAIYLHGRFKANLVVQDAAGHALYKGTKELDHLSFTQRDTKPLPILADSSEATPYGSLKLVDEIDCSQSLNDELHPYLQCGFDKAEMQMSPGTPIKVTVHEILGKKARESENGWFAYRIGRGKLKPHATYLLRIEYPEDKPRYCPIEIQAGRNYLDVGWQNGIKADDPYDPWPLSHSWQWYDTVVPLDDETTGASGTYGAPAENGFWIYFMNKVGKYYSLYDGGPAVARMKLYEIDPEKNAPTINLPKDLPQRVLMFDWERQPESEPEDLARFAKLMGYNAVSPVIIKWGLSNWSEPLNGYGTTGMDSLNYWVENIYKAGANATPAVPGKESQHLRYLAATKRYGIRYVPRFEYGGSLDLPVEAHGIGKDGKHAKPDRFAQWCADLLHPATWDDLQKLMEHLIKPYAKDNPQMTGALWRIRQDRMQISYSKFDLDLFAKETGKLPNGTDAEQRAWASGGAGREAYDGWWLEKRAQFHGKLAALLQGYRPDMKLYYYNWDGDKFGLILNSMTSWAFNKGVAFSKDGHGRAVYEKDREDRKKLTGEDYVNVMRSGAFLSWNNMNRADYALRPELYRGIKGVELLAPVNALWCADNPVYIDYFKTAEGLAVSNAVMYDEIGSRTINPRYEGSCLTPAGSDFSMALEVMAWFHGDARTLTYTTYTYGRGFADAHRRFAQAFLALPAIEGTVVEQGDKEVKVRAYSSQNGIYVGVAYKGYAAKKITVKVPAKEGAKIVNLVTNEIVPARFVDNEIQFELTAGPMELNAFLVQ